MADPRFHPGAPGLIEPYVRYSFTHGALGQSLHAVALGRLIRLRPRR